MVYESVVIAPVPLDTQLPIEAILAAIDVSRMVPLTLRALAAAPKARAAPVTAADPFTVVVLGCGRSGLLALTLCAG